jgi:hypothetical protein
VGAVKKTRRLFFLVSGVSTVMGIVAACTFPEPKIIDGVGEGGPDSGGDVDPTETGGDVAVSDASSDGFDFDGPPPIDATSDKPFVDAAGCFCDCDKDGYRSAQQDAAACPEGGVHVTLTDCDDLDPRANPDAGFVADLPTQDTKGDWNCDGKYTLEWALGVDDCASYSSGLLGSGGCASVVGFQAEEVSCGVESTTWLQCASPPITGACKTGAQEKRVQRCK